MSDNDGGRREREYDVITFIVAGVLAVILLGAIGYGVFSSSRVTTAIPAMKPNLSATPTSVTTTGAKGRENLRQ
jgi:hypothetical protein